MMKWWTLVKSMNKDVAHVRWDTDDVNIRSSCVIISIKSHQESKWRLPVVKDPQWSLTLHLCPLRVGSEKGGRREVERRLSSGCSCSSRLGFVGLKGEGGHGGSAGLA